MSHPCREGDFCLLDRSGGGGALLAREVKWRDGSGGVDAYQLILRVRHCPWCGLELAKEQEGAQAQSQ